MTEDERQALMDRNLAAACARVEAAEIDELRAELERVTSERDRLRGFREAVERHLLNMVDVTITNQAVAGKLKP